MDSKPVLRVGLIGSGHISRQHAPGWAATPDATPVAICEIDRVRAESRREQLRLLGVSDVAIFRSVDEMLGSGQIDCVDIATRPETHLAMVERAATAGVQVLCQKPLAATLDEAQKMVESCQVAGVRFMVMEMWRFLPWFRDLRRFLDAGVIGPAHYLRVIGSRRPLLRQRPVDANQPYFADMPRLVVYEMQIHWIDCARYLLGEVESAYMRGGRLNPAIVGEDWAVVVLGHANAGTTLLESSRATPTDNPPPRREGDVLLEGTDGALHFDPVTLELRLARLNGSVEVVARYADVEEGFQSAFNAAIAHFAVAVRRDEPFESSAEDNLRTLATTFACYDSFEQGRVVSVPKMG
ncbi:MAG TPA: Gfo/Idh/MocA family oxidoreductase [Chloroflexota bacterium]|nr:Gfo/Idh/MocA family oxidoreductase [Chloroflexota bacterium]